MKSIKFKEQVYFAILTKNPDGYELNFHLRAMFTRLNDLKDHLEEQWKGYEYIIDIASIYEYE